MTSRIPEPGSELEADGIPDMGATLPGKEVTGDAQEGSAPPGDIQTDAEDVEEVGASGLVSDDYGLTEREMHDGEPVSTRVEREEPDVLTDAAIAGGADPSADADNPYAVGGGGDSAGRLVESDEGASSDREADAVARDAGQDLGGFTAEEGAMHVEPEA